MAQFRGARRLWPTSAFLYLRAIRFEAVKIFSTRERFRLNVIIKEKKKKKKRKKLKRTEGEIKRDTRYYKNRIHKILDYSIQFVYERWNIYIIV